MQQTYPENPAVPSIACGTIDSDATYRQPVPAVVVVGNRQQLKQLVVDALAHGARRVVLQMHECEYVDASGCGVLVSIQKKCREAGATLVLAGLTADVRTIFEVTKLDTLFEVIA